MSNQKLQISIVNALTGNQIVRDATENEIDTFKIVEENYLKQQAEAEEAKAAEEAAKQQAFNDAVAAAVAVALAAQQTPATTSEPVVEEPIVTEE